MSATEEKNLGSERKYNLSGTVYVRAKHWNMSRTILRRMQNDELPTSYIFGFSLGTCTMFMRRASTTNKIKICLIFKKPKLYFLIGITFPPGTSAVLALFEFNCI